MFHYWALFDGHAGSGAAVVASRLLQHHIACQLQAVIDILRNMSSPPPTVLGEELDNNNPHLQGNVPGSHRALTRAASLRGAMGMPGSPCSTPPPPRFFTEKKIEHESLVVGAIENAFKEMVRHRCKFETSFILLITTICGSNIEKCAAGSHRRVLLFLQASHHHPIVCSFSAILPSTSSFHTQNIQLKLFFDI